VALVAGQEKGIGKTIHTFINLRHCQKCMCWYWAHIAVITHCWWIS